MKYLLFPLIATVFIIPVMKNPFIKLCTIKGNKMKYYLIILLFTIPISVFGQENFLFQKLEKGACSVGFEEIHLTDYSRIYKDDFREIQMAVWFPITNPQGERLKIIDYLTLYNSEDKYEESVEIESFWQNQINRINKNASFEKICNANSLAFFEPLPKNSKYPLILYAAGGQGESFENFLICEVLASRGFIVAAIPSVGTYIHEMNIDEEGLTTQTQDLQVVLRYLNEQTSIDHKNVGTFGWSWGGLSALYLETIYTNVEAYVSLDGSVAGYQSVIENLPFYGVEKITAASLYFATSEDTKIRTLKYIDKTLYSNSTFISLDSIEHSNFNTYSYLAQVFADTSPNENVLEFYPLLVNTVSDFFTTHLIEKKENLFKIESKLSLIDTVAYYKGVAPPLRQDQLISLIEEKGVEEGLMEYKKMKKLNPEYVPFQAFELTKLAFSLQRDSTRTNESVEVMNIVITEYPTSASSHALRGRIYEIRAEYQQALADFKKALLLKDGQNQPEEVVFYEDINWYKKKIEELEKK